MVEILNDISEQISHLAKKDNIATADVRECYKYLSEKHGHEDYFQQIFYAILSIKISTQ
jgi:hypothetical protein